MRYLGFLIILIFSTCGVDRLRQESASQMNGSQTPAGSPSVFSSPDQSLKQSGSIREVDFKNFSYDWYADWADAPKNGRKIVLKDGKMDLRYFGEDQEPREFSLLSVSYGDLTGDGNEEAVVVIQIMMSGTGRPHLVFVYTISQAHPKRLWVQETGDRADRGLRQVLIEDGRLVIDRYTPAIVHNDDTGEDIELSTSISFARDSYAWNGNDFVTIKTEILPSDPNDKNPWVVHPTPPQLAVSPPPQ